MISRGFRGSAARGLLCAPSLGAAGRRRANRGSLGALGDVRQARGHRRQARLAPARIVPVEHALLRGAVERLDGGVQLGVAAGAALFEQRVTRLDHLGADRGLHRAIADVFPLGGTDALARGSGVGHARSSRSLDNWARPPGRYEPGTHEASSISATVSRLSTRIVPAYAKLNLSLAVVARRADGWHDIDSVLVPVDWHDLVGISLERADADAGVADRRRTGGRRGPERRWQPHRARRPGAARPRRAAARDSRLALQGRPPRRRARRRFGRRRGGASGRGRRGSRTWARTSTRTGWQRPHSAWAAMCRAALAVGTTRPRPGRPARTLATPPLHLVIASTTPSSTADTYAAVRPDEIGDDGRSERLAQLLAAGQAPDPDLMGSALEAAACRANPALADALRASTPGRRRRHLASDRQRRRRLHGHAPARRRRAARGSDARGRASTRARAGPSADARRTTIRSSVAVADAPSVTPPTPETCDHPAPVTGIMAHEFAHYEGAVGPGGAAPDRHVLRPDRRWSADPRVALRGSAACCA